MEEEEIGDVTASDVTEDTELYSEEPIVEETIELEEEEEVVSKSEYEKLKEIAENQRIRAEKAEKKLKGDAVATKVEPAENKNDLSAKDLYAFMEAKIPRDDIDEVLEYSKLKNIPVTEALQSSVVKAILADKAEQRNVQQASNTGTVRRGSSKISDETLLSKASKGELPDNEDDLKRLIRLKKGLK